MFLGNIPTIINNKRFRLKYLSWKHYVVGLFPNLNLADLTKLNAKKSLCKQTLRLWTYHFLVSELLELCKFMVSKVSNPPDDNWG